MQIICKKCNAVIDFGFEKPFTGCECGATLPPSILKRIDSLYGTARELNQEILQHSSEGLFDYFQLVI